MPALSVRKKKPRQPRRRVAALALVLVASIAAAVVGWRVWQPGNTHAA